MVVVVCVVVVCGFLIGIKNKRMWGRMLSVIRVMWCDAFVVDDVVDDGDHVVVGMYFHGWVCRMIVVCCRHFLV